MLRLNYAINVWRTGIEANPQNFKLKYSWNSGFRSGGSLEKSFKVNWIPLCTPAGILYQSGNKQPLVSLDYTVSTEALITPFARPKLARPSLADGTVGSDGGDEDACNYNTDLRIMVSKNGDDIYDEGVVDDDDYIVNNLKEAEDKTIEVAYKNFLILDPDPADPPGTSP